MVDTIHAGISKSILATSLWLDSFFYDPRYAVEENTTRAILRYDIFDESHQHIDEKFRMRIKLVLPYLKRKAHLVIAGDPDEQTAAQEIVPENVSAKTLEQNPNATAGLGYFFKSDERRNVSIRAGLRYRNSRFVLFFRPHYRVLYHVGSWNLRLTQEFPYWTDTKWESLSVVDLEREFAKKFFFRSSLVGHWYETTPGYFYSVVFTLMHPLSPRRALSYEWVNNFQTKPDERLQETVFVVRYRQQLWRKWLFGEIAPQARFPRDRNFGLVPGVLFRLEMQFGKF